MSESERRRGYRYDRILIGTDRVLTPQFDDAVVYLTGAQVEMLRNVTQYLNRLSTYVTEHHLGYYLAPTPEDYDDILEIVADLEETLMGNENTIWGFYERWQELKLHTVVGNGHYYLAGTAVPEGYVYVLEGCAHRNMTTAVTQLNFIKGGAVQMPIGDQALGGVGSFMKEQGLRYTMQADDYVQCTFYNCLDGDDLQLYQWGYKMKVPV